MILMVTYLTWRPIAGPDANYTLTFPVCLFKKEVISDMKENHIKTSVK